MALRAAGSTPHGVMSFHVVSRRFMSGRAVFGRRVRNCGPACRPESWIDDTEGCHDLGVFDKVVSFLQFGATTMPRVPDQHVRQHGGDGHARGCHRRRLYFSRPPSAVRVCPRIVTVKPESARPCRRLQDRGTPGRCRPESWIAPRSNALQERAAVSVKAKRRNRQKTENPLDRGAIHDSGHRSSLDRIGPKGRHKSAPGIVGNSLGVEAQAPPLNPKGAGSGRTKRTFWICWNPEELARSDFNVGSFFSQLA